MICVRENKKAKSLILNIRHKYLFTTVKNKLNRITKAILIVAESMSNTMSLNSLEWRMTGIARIEIKIKDGIKQ